MKYKRLFLKLSQTETESAIQRFHFEDQRELIYRLLPKFDLWIRPECFYLYDKTCHEMVTVVVTLGSSFDRHHQEFLDQDQILEAHAMDCLSLALLSQSYEKIKELIHREKRQFVTSMVFPEDYEISEIIHSFQELSDEFPVNVNAAGALIPSKTVVFRGKLSSYHESSADTCTNCHNHGCPFRSK